MISVMHVLGMHRFRMRSNRHLAELGYRLGASSYSLYLALKPGLSPASGFEHPASTLPTRFPAALGIGHGLPAA